MTPSPFAAVLAGLALLTPLALAGPDAPTAPRAEDAPPQEAPPYAYSDAEVAARVGSALLLEPSVAVATLEASAEDGVVTLSGEAPHLLARDRAIEVASSLRGVRAVIDRVEIRPVEVDDDELLHGVEAALALDPTTEAYEVQIAVQDGEVTLAGEVDSWQERALAERLAKGVAGVRGVENALTLRESAEREPEEVAQDVRSRLRWDTLVDDGMLVVNVDAEGQVILRGSVGSLAERRRAEELALVRGATAVDAERVKIAAWKRTPDLRGSKYLDVSDAEVLDALRAALRYDPRVDVEPIRLSLANAEVTLEGTVSSLKARRAAERDAQHVVGVRSVRNLLEVEGEPPTDAALEVALELVLARDAYVGGRGLTVRVEDGVVHLAGTVATPFERAVADDACARVSGVLRVENALEVEEPEQPFYERLRMNYGWGPTQFRWTWDPPAATRDPALDPSVQATIESELRWSPFVDEEDVEVFVQEGVAHLTGTVGSHMERKAAIQCAYDGGARDVEAELTVEDATPSD
ncbi:MAG: BON domain-containing protein [Planctomycetota bacterium]